MEGSRVSDFSIERILSPQLGHKDFPADGYIQTESRLSLDSGNPRPPGPVPVPVPLPGCLQYQAIGFGEVFYPYGAGIHTVFNPNSGVFVHFSGRDSADPQTLPSYYGYHQTGMSAQWQQRQKGRMRTVFTYSQTKQLEALFDLTDYPVAEARAEVARSTELSEETVRVWFKNRRARRRRQRSGSKVKPLSPPPCTGTEKRLFTSFL